MRQKVKVNNLEFQLMIEEDQILKRTRLMGIDLSRRYEDSIPVFIGVLNGSFMFMADLLKQISILCEMSFTKLSSYHGTEQSEIRELIGLNTNLEGRHVVIVEDIVDSGKSLQHTIDAVKKYHPASVIACSLLLKPDALQVQIPELEYVGFEIPNDFVIGYGLDYDGLCRNLPHIYHLTQD